MRDLALVFGIRLRSLLASTLDIRWQTVAKNLSSLIIFGGFAVGIFFIARASSLYLLQQAHIGLFLFHRFLSMLFYVFFLTVNLGNLIVCYATLYKSDEVRFLMSLPISHTRVFLVRFVDNFFYSSSTLAMIGTALLLGYGSCFALPWYFTPITIGLVFLPFMLIAGLVAAVVLMILLKVAARVGFRWLVAAMTAVYCGAVYLYFHLSNPVGLVQEVMKHYPDVNEYFGELDPPLVRWLPNHWVSEYLYWTVTGDWWRGVPYVVLLLLLLVAALLLAWVCARTLYYRSWVAAADARPASAMPGVRLRSAEFGARRVFRPTADAVLRRDFWMFVREPSQWLHLLLMIVLLVIFLVSISSLEMKVTVPLLQVVSFLVVYLFNGFLIASIALRFVFPAVSLEGEAFWSVKSAPVSLAKLYLLKFLVAFATVFVVSEALSITSMAMIRDDGLLVLLSAVSTGCIALTLTAVNLGSGAYFSAYKEKNPIRIASSQGASLTFLASMMYLAFVVVILVIPLNSYFESIVIRGVRPTGWVFFPLAAIAAVSAMLVAVFTGIGLKHIKRDF
jgi:ABC-2 type transport system permease protein